MDINAVMDRIKGAIFGVAIGDALGAPLEFIPREFISDGYGGKLREMVGGGWLELQPGEVTDDTELTLCVAEGIVAYPEDPYKAIGEKLHAWYKTEPKDIGFTCRSVISSVNAGSTYDVWAAVSQSFAEENPTSAGNGSLMRCIYPLIYYKTDKHAIEVAVKQGAMTHANPECTSVIKKYGKLIRAALKGDIPAYGRNTCGKATGGAGDTLSCVIWSMLNADSFEESVVNAINLGNDADTVGAVTGGLAGAVYGYSNIPQRWLVTLPLKIHEKLETLAAEACINLINH